MSAPEKISHPMNPPAPKGGVDDAFVVLLTTHQNALHAFINSLLPGEGCVDDVLQQTNLVLWKKRGDFDSTRSFLAWAFAFARWEARAWITRQKRSGWLVFSDDLTEMLARRFEMEIPASDGTILDALGRCVTKLKMAERELVLDFYQNEKSLIECAATFQRSAGSLKVTLFRIRQALRRCIDAQLSILRTQS